MQLAFQQVDVFTAVPARVSSTLPATLTVCLTRSTTCCEVLPADCLTSAAFFSNHSQPDAGKKSRQQAVSSRQ